MLLKLRKLLLAVAAAIALVICNKKFSSKIVIVSVSRYQLHATQNKQHKVKINRYQNSSKEDRTLSRENTSRKPAHSCPESFFKVAGMKSCHKWLECKEIEEIAFSKQARKYPLLGKGYSKLVYRIPWRNESIHFAMSITGYKRVRKIAMDDVSTRMKKGVANLLKLQPSSHVIQVIGHCEVKNKTILVTEYCKKYGSLENFLLKQLILDFSALQRLQIVIQLIECLVFLHYQSGPSKVHCDMHNPLQALRQFLLTDDKNVVLADLDEIPEDDPKNNKIAKCLPEARCTMSNSKFLAPEQRYTKQECRAVEKFMKPGSNKADTWKIPFISKAILNETIPNDLMAAEVKNINEKLDYIHEKCKYEDIKMRPTSQWVLNEYKKVFVGL